MIFNYKIEQMGGLFLDARIEVTTAEGLVDCPDDPGKGVTAFIAEEIGCLQLFAINSCFSELMAARAPSISKPSQLVCLVLGKGKLSSSYCSRSFHVPAYRLTRSSTERPSSVTRS